MKVRVLVTLKDGVLDPQGKAVEHSLHELGFAEASGVRVGRLIEFVVGGSPAEAKSRVEQMCEKLLSNPVIEKYSIELGKFN